MIGTLLAMLIALSLPSCVDETLVERDGEARPFTIAVSISPLHGLVRPLTPPGGRVVVILPASASPHDTELSPSQVLAAHDADLLVYIGGGADPAAERLARMRSRSGRPSLSFFEALTRASHSHHHHAHDDDDHHRHHEHHAHHGHSATHDHAAHQHTDFHPWLDPTLVAELIPALRRGIEDRLAERGELSDLRRRRIADAEQSLLEEIRRVDAAFGIMLSGMHGVPVVSFHGAFDQVFERYGLRISATIQPAHGVEPTPSVIAGAVRTIREHDAAILIVESNFPRTIADRLHASTGVRIATLDPLGDGDWSAMMRANLEQLVLAFTVRNAETSVGAE